MNNSNTTTIALTDEECVETLMALDVFMTHITDPARRNNLAELRARIQKCNVEAYWGRRAAETAPADTK